MTGIRRFGKIVLVLMVLMALAGSIFVRSGAYRQLMEMLQALSGLSYDIDSFLPPPELQCDAEAVAEVTVADVEFPRFNTRLGFISMSLPFEGEEEHTRIYTPIRLDVTHYIRSTASLSRTNGFMVSYEPHERMNLLAKGDHGIVFLKSDLLNSVNPDDQAAWHRYLNERARTLTRHDSQFRTAVVIRSYKLEDGVAIESLTETRHDVPELVRRIEQSTCLPNEN